MVMRQRGDKDWEQCLPEVPSNADKRGEANISDWRWKVQNWISPSALCHRTAVRSKCLTRGTKKPKSQEKAFEQALHLLNNGLEKNYWSVKDQFVFTSLKCDFKVNIFPKIFLLKDVKTKYLDWDSRSKSHLPVICLSWQQDCLRGNSTTSPVTQNKSLCKQILDFNGFLGDWRRQKEHTGGAPGGLGGPCGAHRWTQSVGADKDPGTGC